MVRNIGGTGDVSRSGGGGDSGGDGGGSAGSQRAIDRLRDRFGGGQATQDGGGDGGQQQDGQTQTPTEPQPTPPAGAERAIEQAPGPADQQPSGGGQQPQPGAQRAIEQAPDAPDRTIGGGQATPTRQTPPAGARRAIEQAPEPIERDRGPQSEFDVRGPRAAQGVGFSEETVEQTGEAGPGLLGGIYGAAAGPRGAAESAVWDVAFGVRDVSAGAVQFGFDEFVVPTAGFFGEAVESVPIVTSPVATIGPGGDIGVGGTVAQPAEEQLGVEESGDGGFIDTTPETVPGGAAERTAAGAGRGLLEATVGIPAGAVEVGNLGVNALEFTAGAVEEEGAEGLVTAGQAGLGFGVEAGQQFVETAQERPFFVGGMIGGGVLGGVGGARALERATTGARIRAETSGRPIDFEDITSTRGAEGEPPRFRTDPEAPTGEAVREVRQRAEDQPESIQAEAGESVLFRSEAERLPGDVEADIGQYELPGLFASPDASPLRLDIGAESSLSSLRPRLPRPFGTPQRLSGFEAPDIEGMPESATGAARVVDPEGGTMPDPTTSGFEFLTEGAETGVGYVRPTGSRTPELEAIFAPGSQFAQTTTRRVDVPGGRGATLDIFRRTEGDGDVDVDAPEGEFTPEDIISRETRGGTPEGTPVTPFNPTPTGTATATGGTAATTSPQGVSPDFSYPPGTFGGTPSGGGTTGGPSGTGGGTTTGPTTTGGGSTGGTTGGGATEGSTSGPTDPSGIFTGTPTDPTSPPSGSPPTEPPGFITGPPTSGPPSTPTRPPSGPPSQPPTSIPGLPGQPPSEPSRPIRLGDDTTDDDENEFQPLAPEGEEFVNPVAGGFEFLFGGP